MKLFSGTANPALSQEVAKNLGVELARSEAVRFGNSEVRVRILDNITNEICVVIQPSSNPTDTHLMELFFFADALKRGGAKEIIAVIPYFGYARQNIQHRTGEAVSANVVVRLLETVGFNRIFSFDMHDEGTAGIFSIPFTHLSALPLLASEIKKILNNQPVAIISPDQGGVERARSFANSYSEKDDTDIVIIEKKRDQDVAHQSIALELYGDVKDKTAIIIDDIVTSGGTLLNATQLCLDKGATDVYAGIVHHDLAPDAMNKLQQSSIKKFFTTNTITLADNHRFEKLEEISVAEIIAEQLRHL